MLDALRKDAREATVKLVGYPVTLLIRGLGVGVTASFSALRLYPLYYRAAADARRGEKVSAIAHAVQAACTQHLIEAWRLVIRSYAKDPKTSREALGQARAAVARSVVDLLRQMVVTQDSAEFDELLRRWAIATREADDDEDYGRHVNSSPIFDDTALAGAYEAARQRRLRSMDAAPFFRSIRGRVTAIGLLNALERQYDDTGLVDLSDWAFDNLPVDEAGFLDWETDAFAGILAVLGLMADDDGAMANLSIGLGLRSRIDTLRGLVPTAVGVATDRAEAEIRQRRVSDALDRAAAAFDAADRARIRSAPRPPSLASDLGVAINRAFAETDPFSMLHAAGAIESRVVPRLTRSHRRATRRLLPKSWFLSDRAIANEDMVLTHYFVDPFARAERDDLLARLSRVPVRWTRLKSLKTRVSRAVSAVTPTATHILLPRSWEVRRGLMEAGLVEPEQGGLRWLAGELTVVELTMPEDEPIAYVLSLPTAVHETRKQLQAGEPLSVRVRWLSEEESQRLAEEGVKAQGDNANERALHIQEHFEVEVDSEWTIRIKKSAIAAVRIG